MSDLATIRIPVDSSDMVKAVREAKNLESGVKMLFGAFKSGAIGIEQYNGGLLTLKRKYEELFTSSQQATARVRAYAAGLQQNTEEARQNALAQEKLAIATKKAETAFALAEQKAKADFQAQRNRSEFAWAMAMQREKESQMAVKAAERQAQASTRLTHVMQDSSKGARQSELFIQQLGYQVGDFAVQVQSGTSALVAFAQQGTQILGFLPMAGAFGAVAGAVLAVSTAVLNLGFNMASSKDSITQAKEALEAFTSSFSSLESAQTAVKEAQERYTQAIYLSGQTQVQVTPQILQALALEADAQDRLLRVEQARFELKKFELEQVIQQQREVVAGLMEEVNLLQDPDASSSAFTRTQQESARLEIVKGIVKANQELFLSLTENQAQLDLINSLLGGSSTEFDDILAKAKELGIVIPGIDFSAPLSAARQLAEELGVSVGLAARLSSQGLKDVIYDPRDPRYDPVVAEMAKIQANPGTVSPFDPSRQPKEKTGGGSARRETEIRKQIDLTKELTQAEKDRLSIVRSVESSLEDGFMAMVDGTSSVKDAFKSMARDIIKELYRVLVVQRMVGAISGAVNMFSLPSGPSTGTLGLPKFASGGSMMPGKPYVVGEHGPELVVPRHSGTVVNANQTANALGGDSGGFTQNLTISVTGSDAAMVRAEVAKMIPQITNATKAAVIDAKQRGGQMAAAFR